MAEPADYPQGGVSAASATPIPPMSSLGVGASGPLSEYARMLIGGGGAEYAASPMSGAGGAGGVSGTSAAEDVPMSSLDVWDDPLMSIPPEEIGPRASLLAPAAMAPAPQPIGPSRIHRAARPQLPPALQPQHGGYYYPEDYPAQILERAEDLPAGAGPAALERYGQYLESTPGLEVAGARQQQRWREREIAAAAREAEAAIRLGETSEPILIAAEKAAAEAQKRATRQTAMWQRAYDAQLSKYQDTIRDYEAGTIDPGRYWANVSTGQKIAAVISAALFGFATGGRGNVMLEMIQRAIDADIAAQEKAIARKRGAVEMQESLVGLMRERLGDQQSASAAARTIAYEDAARQIEAWERAHLTEQQKERLALLKEGLRHEAKMSDLGIRARAQQYADADAQARQTAMHAAAQAEHRAQKAEIARAFDAQYGKPITPFEADRWIVGRGVAITGSEGLNRLRLTSAQFRAFDSNMQVLERIYATPGAARNPVLRARAEAIAASGAATGNVLLDQAAMSEVEIEKAKVRLGELRILPSLETHHALDRLKETRKYFANIRDEQMRAFQVQPATLQNVPDPETGIVQTRIKYHPQTEPSEEPPTAEELGYEPE